MNPEPPGPAASASSGAPEAPAWGSLWRVVEVQAHNALNDKVAQFVLLALGQVLLISDVFSQLVTGLLVLPQLFFAPLAGWLCDRFSKRLVIIACSISQVFLLLLVAAAFRMHWVWVATVIFFLLAIQAAVLFPAKSGICKELVGERNLTKTSGWTQMTTIMAFALGPLIGGKAFQYYHDHVFAGSDEHTRGYQSAAVITLILAAFALIPLILSFQVKPTPSHSGERFRRGMLTQHFSDFAELFAVRNLRLTAFGVSFFWLVATMLMLVTIELAKAVEPNKAAQAGLSAELLCVIAGGVVLGSIITSLLSGDRIELGLVPIGGIGMATASIMGAIVDPAGLWFRFSLLGIGVFSAMFLIPTSAHLQNIVEPQSRGRMLSASGLMDSMGMLAGIFIQLALMKMGFGIHWQMLTLSLLCLTAAIIVVRIIPQNFLRFTILSLVRIIYRVRVFHCDRIPETGGALLVCNHVSYIDAFILSAACPRPVRFTAFDDFFKNPALNILLRLFGVVPISNRRAKNAIVALSDAIRAGDLVCIFPEGQITRTGMLNEIRKGFELIARRGGAPVIPVYLDDLWGSIFSFERGRFFRKHPHHFPYHISVLFGEPIPFPAATTVAVRDGLQALSGEGIRRRGEVASGLPQALAQACSREPWRIAVMDSDGTGRYLRRAEFFGRAMQLARRWRAFPAQNIGIVLPAGLPSVLAQAALVLAGKTAWQLSPGITLPSLLQSEGITTVITSLKMRQETPGFPWPDHLLDITTEMQEIDEFYVIADSALACLAPAFLMSLRVRVTGGGLAGGGEAGRTFRMSGGEVLIQTEMLRGTDLFHDRDRLLCTAPLYEVEGTVAGVWTPLLHGASIMPAERHARDLRRSAGEFSPNIALGGEGTDSLLSEPVRAFLCIPPPRGTDLPPDTYPCMSREAMLTISMPHPPAVTSTSEPQAGSAYGSVGRLLPGIRHDSGNSPDSLTLTLPDTRSITLSGAWRVDEQGFLFPP